VDLAMIGFVAMFLAVSGAAVVLARRLKAEILRRLSRSPKPIEAAMVWLRRLESSAA
jgi:hypothetical protein